jgi:hypothetical protein
MFKRLITRIVFWAIQSWLEDYIKTQVGIKTNESMLLLNDANRLRIRQVERKIPQKLSDFGPQ